MVSLECVFGAIVRDVNQGDTCYLQGTRDKVANSLFTSQGQRGHTSGLEEEDFVASMVALDNQKWCFL